MFPDRHLEKKPPRGPGGFEIVMSKIRSPPQP
jgi:hypothetical protein